MERRDWTAFAELLAPDVVYEIPQTRERIRGRENYVRFNAEFPGDWHVEPQVIVADEHNGSLLFQWTLAGESSLAIAFFEFEGARSRRSPTSGPSRTSRRPGGSTSSNVGDRARLERSHASADRQ